MKQFLLLLFLTALFFEAPAQSVEYRCFIKSDCSDTIRIFKDYVLSKNNHYYRPDIDAVCLLPDTGTYHFTATAATKNIFSLNAIVISSKENRADTLLTDDLYEVILFGSKKSNTNQYQNWVYCGSPANGYIVDHTMIGRTEGLFRNGKAVKNIKSYNQRGELIFVAYYRHGKELKK